MPSIIGKSLKVTVVLDPASLLTVAVPEAIAAVREYGPDACAAIIQGKLGAGDRVLEAGLVVQERKAKVAAEAVAA